MASFGKYTSESTTMNSTVDGRRTPSSETETGHRRLHEWLDSSETPKRCPCTGAFVLDICPCADAAYGCKNAYPKTEQFGPYNVTRDSEPFKGDKFIIMDKSTKHALVYENGNLRLVEGTDATSSWIWLCVSKDGFLGFQNTKEWTYLGRDPYWGFQAVVKQHNKREFFKTEKRREGGYWIQILWGWEFWQVSAQANCGGLEAERRDGTVWEFVKIND